MTWVEEKHFSDSDVLGVMQTWFLPRFYHCVIWSKLFNCTEVQFLLVWNGNDGGKDSRRWCVSNIWQHPGTQKWFNKWSRHTLNIPKTSLLLCWKTQGSIPWSQSRVGLPPFPLAVSRGFLTTDVQRSWESKPDGKCSMWLLLLLDFPPRFILYHWESIKVR